LRAHKPASLLEPCALLRIVPQLRASMPLLPLGHPRLALLIAVLHARWRPPPLRPRALPHLAAALRIRTPSPQQGLRLLLRAIACPRIHAKPSPLLLCVVAVLHALLSLMRLVRPPLVTIPLIRMPLPLFMLRLLLCVVSTPCALSYMRLRLLLPLVMSLAELRMRRLSRAITKLHAWTALRETRLRLLLPVGLRSLRMHASACPSKMWTLLPINGAGPEVNHGCIECLRVGSRPRAKSLLLRRRWTVLLLLQQLLQQLLVVFMVLVLLLLLLLLPPPLLPPLPPLPMMMLLVPLLRRRHHRLRPQMSLW